MVATVGLFVLLGPIPAAEAHARNYQTSAGVITTCIDDRTVGGIVGGIVGGLLASLVDPFLPDSEGSCYRPNHVWPNVNGDVTFTVSDAVQTNVALCAAQDSDGDGYVCEASDVHTWGCNSVTVNTSLGFRFRDEPGIPALPTYIIVPGAAQGNAILTLLPNEQPCGVGVDSYGIHGNVDHS